MRNASIKLKYRTSIVVQYSYWYVILTRSDAHIANHIINDVVLQNRKLHSR